MKQEKFVKYDKYKNSGIDWLEEIPYNWQSKRVKDIIKNISQGWSPNAENRTIEGYEYGVLKLSAINNGKYNEINHKALPSNIDFKSQYIVKQGDILMTRSNTPELVGDSCLVLTEPIFNLMYSDLVYCMRLKSSKVVDRYLNYFFCNASFRCIKTISARGLNTSMVKISQGIICRWNVFFPSLSEQKAIADYLDIKTVQIDQQIELLKQKANQYSQLKQSLINETVTRGLDKSVPMKDSGVEWIGEVPEHWEVKRIKDTTYVKGRIGWQGLRNEDFLLSGEYYCVTGTDLKNGTIDWTNCYFVDQDRYTQDPHIKLRTNDILITKDGTIGKVAIVDSLPLPATLNSGVFVTRPMRKSYLTKFMYWVYNSSQFTTYIDLTKGGSTIQHLYQNVFNRFAFTCPPLEEQVLISNYLDIKTKDIDSIITVINKKIAVLIELRKTLVNDVVTGKIKVTKEEQAE